MLNPLSFGNALPENPVEHGLVGLLQPFTRSKSVPVVFIATDDSLPDLSVA